MNNTNNQHHHHHHLNLFIYSEVSWYVYDRIAHRYVSVFLFSFSTYVLRQGGIRKYRRVSSIWMDRNFWVVFVGSVFFHITTLCHSTWYRYFGPPLLFYFTFTYDIYRSYQSSVDKNKGVIFIYVIHHETNRHSYNNYQNHQLLYPSTIIIPLSHSSIRRRSYQ